MDVIAQIKREEGCVPYAYADSLGYWTIGVGRLIDKRKGGGLRQDEIDLMLRNDVAAATSNVRNALPWSDQLNEPRRAVLIGMAFQMGTPGLCKFTNTLRCIRGGDYAGGAAGMLDSTWAKQTPERAGRMSKQMLTGEWQA